MRYEHMPYERDLHFALGVANEAGNIMLKYFGKDESAEWKNDNSPLMRADTEINNMVIEAVVAHYPEHGVLGEEKSELPERLKKWVVDPIDGTQDFDMEVPVSTFNLAHDDAGSITVGVINDPFTGRLLYATKGGGAYLNGKKISVSDARTFQSQYFVLSTQINGGHRTAGQVHDLLTDLGGKTFNFRTIAYGLLCVARGKALASYAGAAMPWDVAPSLLILDEAGATVTDLDGNPVQYDNIHNGIVASNGKIHDRVLEVVRRSPITELEPFPWLAETVHA